jgi:hypothetical protein
MQPTPLDTYADVVIHEKAGMILPTLLARIAPNA